MAPPEIWVISWARFVSVFVGAEISLIFMFGFAASKAVISFWRSPAPPRGLAHQLIVVMPPEVPDAEVEADDEDVDDEPQALNTKADVAMVIAYLPALLRGFLFTVDLLWIFI